MKSHGKRALMLLAVYVLCCSINVSQSKVAASDEWQTIDIKGRFSFSLPSSMEQVAYDDSIGHTDGVRVTLYAQGKDVVEAEYSGHRMRLGLDYGRVAAGFSGYENELQIKEEMVDISGRAAKIITYTSRGQRYGHRYFVVMYFVDDDNSSEERPPLFMWVSGEGIAEQEMAKKIFHSIKLLPPAK